MDSLTLKPPPPMLGGWAAWGEGLGGAERGSPECDGVSSGVWVGDISGWALTLSLELGVGRPWLSPFLVGLPMPRRVAPGVRASRSTWVKLLGSRPRH